MSRRRKKGGHGGGGHGEGGSERWLLTYADMITLLTAFFIMMYSMSVMNLTKFHQLAIAIKSGFGGQLDTAGTSVLSPSAGTAKKPMVVTEMSAPDTQRITKQMREYIKQKKLEKKIRLRMTERGLVVSILTDKMLFPKGQANMTPQARQILDKVASVIEKTNRPVRVEGHTDNLPINTAQFPTNWELSVSRATTVVRYLINHDGFSPSRISAAGFADSRPLVPNDSESHRATNRRVDIVILKGGESASDGPSTEIES